MFEIVGKVCFVFFRYGEIVSTFVCTKPNSSESKGCGNLKTPKRVKMMQMHKFFFSSSFFMIYAGFVKFARHEDALKAKAAMHQIQVHHSQHPERNRRD